MKLDIEFDDETIEKLAAAIAEKIGTNGNLAAATDGGDDDFEGGDTPAEITLTDVQDAIKEAVGAYGKDKIKAFVKKTTGVDKVVDIPKEKYQAVLDGLKKVKK